MCPDRQHVRRRFTKLHDRVEDEAGGDNSIDQNGQWTMHRTDLGPYPVW